MTKQGTRKSIEEIKRQEEVKWLQEETKYLELLMKYYSYQLQIPQLQQKFMEQEEAKKKRIEELETLAKNPDNVAKESTGTEVDNKA